MENDTGQLRPTTTAEQDRVSHGQRAINLIWERTQAAIALLVTCCTLAGATLLIARASANDSTAFALMSNAFFLVVGFYFGRTNHQKVGGVGQNYDGR